MRVGPVCRPTGVGAAVTHPLHITPNDRSPGVIDWRPYLPRLYTHMLAAFNVPVATATAAPPMAVSPPPGVGAVFGSKMDQVGRAVRLPGLGL
jgi:hypothetical protein